MAEKPGRGRSMACKVTEDEEGFIEGPAGENPVAVSGTSPSESHLARLRLRERWELASVLNFLHVFEPVISSKLEISAEDIETALIKPNNVLAQIHISLLKGIPPLSKSLSDPDVWVTVLRKKLAMWWPWVAEGEIPLIAAHGEEISRYKELDPTVRLLVLKALCETRAEQDDMINYVNDALKHGTELSTFRKESIAEDGNGTSYWYDGDSIIGHRLYMEINKVEHKPRLKGKRSLTKPTISFKWKTLATNLEEFHEILDKFSSSNIMVESSVGKFVEDEIIPALKELQKKKERALKRQQRQAMLLNGLLNSYCTGNNRSRRDRRPVSYTFDEYDRSIDEALELTNEKNSPEEHRHETKQRESTSNGTLESDSGMAENSDNKNLPMRNDNDDKFHAGSGGDDSSDDDYNQKNDDDDESGDDDDMDVKSEENNTHANRNHPTHHSQKQKAPSFNAAVGLRRSGRISGSINPFGTKLGDHAGTKKRLRQRPNRNTIFDPHLISDSENENSSET